MTHQATTLTRVHADADQSALERAFQDIRESQDVREDFSAEALAEAEAAAKDPSLPEEDLTAIEFITIDPPGSMDLDQAMHIEAIDDAGEGLSGSATPLLMCLPSSPRAALGRRSATSWPDDLLPRQARCAAPAGDERSGSQPAAR
ncbi:hypothetical protein [Ornithinimicrobium sp. INDO-MA30-4]|uniref:hypothetical protein n=1 Tax=Ornithinimicrobium sp. INDO-MA30-4 TaxID=2908651 RepID=UPI001F2B6156|nr:hypothetical protein [Ornithinimicrobium sp. INDO-MA30-4]UJH70939.1 hypothetical protein L0A91_02990 [Ornithinimicrobium sp. INDO-MA30-4]